MPAPMREYEHLDDDQLRILSASTVYVAETFGNLAAEYDEKCNRLADELRVRSYGETKS